MLDADSFIFIYPEYININQDDKVGGYPSNNNLIPEDNINQKQLFDLAILYDSTYIQYQKLFIKNDGDETATNVSIYGYNKNGNNIITLALERGQDRNIIYNGQEIIKDNTTEPNLYVNYTFTEILDTSPLSISDVNNGDAIGIWLKMEFNTIDAFNEQDEFVIGINYQNSNGDIFNKEFIIYHSRIEGRANIIQIKNSNVIFRGIQVEYEYIDTSLLGINENEAIYGIYVDRIFRQENSGLNRCQLELYDNKEIFSVIEVFLLPYSGYRPVLQDLSSDYKHRLKIKFSGKDPNKYDVYQHFVYWDEGTGTYQSKPIASILAKENIGGGENIEYIRRI